MDDDSDDEEEHEEKDDEDGEDDKDDDDDDDDNDDDDDDDEDDDDDDNANTFILVKYPYNATAMSLLVATTIYPKAETLDPSSMSFSCCSSSPSPATESGSALLLAKIPRDHRT